MNEEGSTIAIAITGIGCRLPGGADSPAGFWKLLCEGVDAITELPPDRFNLDEIYDPDPEKPGKIYSKWGGFLDSIDRFDADFFGISPREARRMDPQHRLLLEVVWEAFEDGGHIPERIAGTNTGVFVGISSHDYADMHVRPGFRNLLDAHINIGNALCAAPNRISYLFDFHGPSFAVESACSSSLTAIHLACRSIRSGESDLAVAGGVNLVLAPELTIGFCKASMISPDGRCRAFDAHANGYVRSEGAGAVILKPLQKALEDGDRVYAVIRGTAINEDGRTAGISLPSSEAQEELLRLALKDAGVPPGAIQYVEAHGTGTSAGDPAEAGALGRVFGAGRSPDHPCLIGSAKTNVGHLEAGAGITGLIKAALCLKYRQIPASLHYQEPNPEIPFDDLNIRVATSLEEWPDTGSAAMAGVNSFGFGGANAHVILEETSPLPGNGPKDARTAAHVLVISARTAESLRSYAGKYVNFLQNGRSVSLQNESVSSKNDSVSWQNDGSVSLGDICYTAARRRSHFEHRLSVVGGDKSELAESLDAWLSSELHPNVHVGRALRDRKPRLAFVFSGMGPQWWGMARQLMEEEPVYHETLSACDRLLRPIAGWSLLEELGRDEAESRIASTDYAHVANCALQVALAELWRSRGIEPDAVTGHSSGEIAAACVSGALSLEEALYLAYHRGMLQHSLSGTGGMLAAAISPEEAEAAMAGYEDRVSLAAFNSPNSITLSGDMDALEAIATDLERRDLFCRILKVDVPYHAPQMVAIRDELLDLLKVLKPGPAKLPFVSSTTGALLNGPEVDGSFWWRNARDPVRFEPAVRRLLKEGCDIFLEVGPHPVLAAYLTECAALHDRSVLVLSTLRRMEDDRTNILRTLGALHAAGRKVDWQRVYDDGAHVTLPSYPWQRESFWFDTQAGDTGIRPQGIDTGHPILGRRISSPQPTWECDLEDPALDFMDDHVVQGSVVFPGAGYVEVMLAAAASSMEDFRSPSITDRTDGQESERSGKEAPLTLEGIEFSKLLFPGDPRSIILNLRFHPRESFFELHAAPKEPDPPWTLHASATLGRSAPTAAAGSLDLDAVRARCTAELAVSDHFSSLEARGFHYGEAFRGLREIWYGEGEAIARIDGSAGLELPAGAYQVHPALLDAAFQVAAVAAALDREREKPPGPLFPVSIRRATLLEPAGTKFWAHIAARQSDDEHLEADIRLVDDSGKVCASFERLRMKLLDTVDTGHHSIKDDFLYELRWEESPLVPTIDPGSRRVRQCTEIREEVESAHTDPELEPDVRLYHDTVEPALNRIATEFARSALRKLGAENIQDVRIRDEALAETLGIVPQHRRLFRELLAVLAASDDRAEGDPRITTGNGTSLQHRLDQLAADAPAYDAEIELLRRGGTHLAEILCGETDVREVLLSGDSLDILSRMYHSSPACRIYHTVLGDAVGTMTARPDDSTRLRVIEIGAGTGAATSEILPRLPEGTDYLFTDISPFFLTEARERFGKHARFDCSALDIEKDPAHQGYQPHSFDLVVADNVLHTTQDLRTSLRHVRNLLAPGGLLMLTELSIRAPWLNLVFGLLEGWWRFTDLALRPDYPLLNAAEWCSLLEEEGFSNVTQLFGDRGANQPLQSVLIAQARDDAAPAAEAVESDEIKRNWLFFADDRGIGDLLAERLRNRGHEVLLAHREEADRRSGDLTGGLAPADSDTPRRLLEDMAKSGFKPDGIVHLRSLDAEPGDDPTGEGIMEMQKSGCESVLAIVKALEQSDSLHPEIWLVTSAAQSVDAEPVPNFSHATIWGLGRVLMNEHTDTGCRLVDLSAAASPEELDALVSEMTADRSEDEIAFRGNRRFVRRLTRVSLKGATRNMNPVKCSPDRDSFHLEIENPGTLDSLYLVESPSVKPGPGEVAIRVRASGLNFREVLQSLGMLPPEAEADGHGLGVECAGIVEACGDDIEDFRPGDEVIALASPAHASRTIAPAFLVVPKPDTISFAEAATVINAFVTAEYSLNHVARLAAGERVLLHSASGAVGLAAIQLCRAAGAEIFATAGTSEKRSYLESLGVAHAMDSRSLDFYEEVLEVTGGEGIDIVLNALTGEAMQKSLALLRPYGRFVELGKRDIYRNAQLGMDPFRKNLTYTALDLMQLAVDRPAFANRMLHHVVEQLANGTWKVVPHTAFDLADAEDGFRFMAQARHIGKVVLMLEKPEYRVVPSGEQQICRADGTYLITGGLGGFGLASAERLVRQGAGCVVLMSRSGIPKDENNLLESLRKSPARVEVVKGDVADEEDVRRALDHIRRELPPLRGIIHAAMVLSDDMLVRLDDSRLRQVLAPKVAGAWNLHRCTKGDELDFFVLYSSIASVIGHALQGNYAAANAFLDTFASWRRAQGFHCLAVGWGAVAGAGYVSRHPEVSEYLERSGFGGFTPEEALDVLELLLKQEMPHVVAARLDWRIWMERNPAAASLRRFQSLVSASRATAGAAKAPAGESLASLLTQTSPGDRLELLGDYLLQRVARVLGTTPEKVDPGRPFTELGFDSLMTVELITALKSDLGVKIPVVKVLQGINANDLATLLLDELRIDAAPSEPGESTGLTEGPEEYPLSFEQRRFWLLDRLDPENPAYNLPAVALLSGPLNMKALKKSITGMVDRHEVLRAAVREAEGGPVQRFAAPGEIPLPVSDLRNIDGLLRDQELQRRMTEEIRQPFDLGSGQLFRVTLFRMDEEEHVILLVVHHMACDAWSMNMMVREMALLYDACSEGRDIPLPELPFRYVDYVRRQQDLLTNHLSEQQIDYWRIQLSGAPAAINLPRIRTEPADLPGGHQSYELSPELTRNLQAFSAREGATLFMTLLAAFQTLLFRYSGDEDVCVGTAVSRRDQPGAEAVAGCFMNTLVLRSDLSGDPPFRELLQKVRKTTLEAFENGDVPFDRVVERVRPERAAGRTPLFQAMLVLHNAKLPELMIENLTVKSVEVESGSSVADVVLLADLDDQLSLTLEYNTAILDADAARRLLLHFERLLAGMVDDPEQSINLLPLLTEPELRRELDDWNDTAVDFGPAQCVHELFEAQVQSVPDAVGVTFCDENHTYAQINRQADQLARHLASLGIGPNDVVGLCCEPSVGRVIALLAILKAAGVYMPLVPTHPPARISFMIRDAGVRLLLAGQKYADSLPHDRPPTLYLEDLLESREGNARTAVSDGRHLSGNSIGVSEPGHERLAIATPDDAAYVMYTSGSTGKPKGVKVPHSAICHQIRARQMVFPIGGGDAVLQHVSPEFDPSVWEYLGTLAAGARLVIPADGESGDAGPLIRCLSDNEVTTLQVVPSLLDVILDDPGIASCKALRQVFCGGERLLTGLRDRFFERLPEARLHNLYGPAEAAIDAAWWTCTPDADADPVPIGRPFPNVEIYILDARQQAVPLGVQGELCIGGPGLASGYLNQPDLTAEKFIPHPFRKEPGRRLYRSGDVGRRLSDGAIEFVGRMDDQVKIRGQRVEPDEISAVLMQHPAVTGALVVADGDEPATRRLIACCVADPQTATDDLQKYVSARLPGYMVPAEYIIVQKMPQLPGGKFDRRALDAMIRDRPSERPAASLAAPRDALELQLVQLWEELLESRPIGVTDNFFDIGGHSLLAMRLVSRIRQMFGRELPPASLVQAGTIEQIAELLRSRADGDAHSSIVAMNLHGTGAPVFFVHPSGGSIICYRELAKLLEGDHPFHGIQSPPSRADSVLATSIEAMAQQYAGEVAARCPAGPWYLGGWSMGGTVAYEMARRLTEEGREVAAVLMIDPPPADPDQKGHDPAERVIAFAAAQGLALQESEKVNLHGMDPEEQLRYLWERLQGAALLPAGTRLSDFRRNLELNTRHMNAVQAYRPQPYGGRVVLVRPAEDRAENSLAADDAWRRLVSGTLDQYVTPGDHFSMLRESHVRILAEQLHAAIGKTELNATTG